MTNKKTTKRENFTEIVKILREGGYEDYANIMEYEIELLNRKNANRKTKPDKARETLKTEVLEILKAHDRLRVSNIIKILDNPDYSTPKISNICNSLCTEGKIEKIVEKRVSYFKAVEVEG